MSSTWLRRLISAGLSQQTLRSLDSLAEVVARAGGMPGVVLWEEAPQNEAPPLTGMPVSLPSQTR